MRPKDDPHLFWVYKEPPVGILFVHVVEDWLEQAQFVALVDLCHHAAWCPAFPCVMNLPECIGQPMPVPKTPRLNLAGFRQFSKNPVRQKFTSWSFASERDQFLLEFASDLALPP